MLEKIYWYFTDFCINMANLLGISYVEFNIWLFIVVLPGFTAVLVMMNIYRYFITSFLSNKKQKTRN